MHWVSDMSVQLLFRVSSVSLGWQLLHGVVASLLSVSVYHDKHVVCGLLMLVAAAVICWCQQAAVYVRNVVYRSSGV
jgi:hypothetical protein